MGSVLGPMLQGQLKRKWAIKARRWGKASSGLARPDYHDWPKQVPRLMKRHRPHYTVVSLGTNDMQPLRIGRKWIKTKNPKWKEVYRERVRKMLDLLTGEERKRGVIWLGPTAFKSRNSRVMGPIINEIIRSEIEAFDGPAVFIDARAATTNEKGKPIVHFTREGSSKRHPARAKDGIHLTTQAVKWLMAKPVTDLLEPCVTRAIERQASPSDPPPKPATETKTAKPKDVTPPQPRPKPSAESPDSKAQAPSHSAGKENAPKAKSKPKAADSSPKTQESVTP